MSRLGGKCEPPFGLPAIASHPGQRGDPTCKEAIVPAGKGVSSRLASTKFFNNPLKHPQRHSLWSIFRIPALDGAVRFDSGEALPGGPFNGSICFSKMPRAGCDSHGIEINHRFQLRANPGSLKAGIAVRRIKHGLNVGFSNDPGEIASTPAEQGTQQPAFWLSRHWGVRSHGRKTANTGTARQPHQQRFCLIIGMVGCRDCRHAIHDGPLTKRVISRRPRALLQRRSRKQCKGQGGVLNAALFA